MKRGLVVVLSLSITGLLLTGMSLLVVSLCVWYKDNHDGDNIAVSAIFISLGIFQAFFLWFFIRHKKGNVKDTTSNTTKRNILEVVTIESVVHQDENCTTLDKKPEDLMLTKVLFRICTVKTQTILTLASARHITDDSLSRWEYWNQRYKERNEAFDWLTDPYLTVQSVLPYLEETKSTDILHLLDLGTGTSRFPSELSKHLKDNFNLFCFDYVKESLQFQRSSIFRSDFRDAFNPFARIMFVCGDAESLPFKADTMNIIFDKGTTDSLLKDKIKGKERTHSVLSEAFRVLCPNGKLLQFTDEDPDNFDIPLTYAILRNIHNSTLEPTDGWDYKTDPQPHQMKTGDDLERCRRRRNKIIHRGNTEVSDQELHEYFDEFRTIARITDLRICCMDEDTETKILAEIEEWRRRGIDYEEQISQLKEHLAAMGISEKQDTENERKPILIELRKYQEELVEIAVSGQNTIICAGTNAGKTYVAYHIIEDHLIKYPNGSRFLNKNVLLEQQYNRACRTFTDLNMQGKIYKWDASLEAECDSFPTIIQRVSLFFCTPQSLCNHLDEKSKNIKSRWIF
ncbi:CSKMT [Mytilus edulis]|uniref:CSKMT n=1 Tax=Mytilus edulis TaxID=6550 RepID=A0A8S3V4E8_MYTED|nr:CSKMT [Mytilus edulis]